MFKQFRKAITNEDTNYARKKGNAKNKMAELTSSRLMLWTLHNYMSNKGIYV